MRITEGEIVRSHYIDLIAKGFQVSQAGDILNADDFVNAFLEGQVVDLRAPSGRLYEAVNIAGIGIDTGRYLGG